MSPMMSLEEVIHRTKTIRRVAGHDNGHNKITYRVAVSSDLASVSQLVNEAFLKDKFFKKQQYYDRFSLDDVTEMEKDPQAMFLVAEDGQGRLCGSIYLELSLHEHQTSMDVDSYGKFKYLMNITIMIVSVSFTVLGTHSYNKHVTSRCHSNTLS